MRKAAGLIGSAAIAGLVAGVLLDVVAFLLVPVLLNSAAIDVSSAMTFFILGWMVAAPMLAAVTPAYENYRSPHPAGLLRKRADLPTGWGGVQLPAHVGAGAILLFRGDLCRGLILAPGS